jgi:hypothetical protein
MRWKFLAGAMALVVISSTLFASSQPASAWYRYRGGPAAAAGAVVGSALAAVTSPFWWGAYGYSGYPYAGWSDPSYGAYAYQPGYSFGYAEPGYSYGYVGPSRDPLWCEQHYRSYDPVSGTFMGYDGLRHRCP